MIHLRNGRAASHPTTRGEGVTWCGKKLLGQAIRNEGLIATHSSYGSEISATLDLDAGTCTVCRERFDAAYNAAFPEGPQPIATFRMDEQADVERAKAVLSPEALTKFFGYGGGGMPEFMAALERRP